MSWEQDIAQKLQQFQSISVRFDIPQELTTTEKRTARDNIEIGSSATRIDGPNYRINFN